MSRLDPNIILSGTQPVNALQLLQAQMAGQQMEAQQLQMEEQRRGVQERNALAQLYADPANREPEGGMTRNALYKSYAVAPSLAPALEKAQLAMAAQRAQMEKDKVAAELDQRKLSEDETGALRDFIAGTASQVGALRAAGKADEEIATSLQDDYTQRLEALKKGGRVRPETLSTLSLRVDPKTIDISLGGLTKYADLIALDRWKREQAMKPPPAPRQILVGDDQVQQEFFDPATQTTSRGPVVQRFPPGPVIQVEGGFARVAPSNTTAPITVGGAQAKPPLSATTKKDIAENNTAIDKIDRALTMARDYPDAFGVKALIPDIALQRLDPKGVDVRAIVADIGSKKLHDRSGANVTINEAPRLKPFIPQMTDDEKGGKVISKKLRQLRQELVRMNDELSAGRSLDDVIHAPAVTALDGADAPVADKVRVNSVAEAKALPSGTIVILPDGREKKVP